MDRRLSQHKSGSRPSLKLPDGLGFWMPKKGAEAYELDFIPFEVTKSQARFAGDKYADVGDLYYERTYFVHANVGPNQEKVLCPAKNFGKPCSVCEHRQKLFNDPKATKKEKGELAPKERQLFLVLDHAQKDKKAQLWDISYHLFGKNMEDKIEHAREKLKPKLRQFYHPDNGYTLRVTPREKVIEGGQPFMEFFVDEFMPRDEPLAEELINHGFDLDAIPVEVSYKDLEKLYTKGEVDDEDADDSGEDDDDDDKPAPKGKRPPADDDEDDEEEEDEGKAADPEFSKGDVVTWTYRNKSMKGVVKKIKLKEQIAEIDVGKGDPAVVDLDELTLADDDEEDDEVEEAPPPKKKAGGKAKAEPVDDEDDDEEEDEDDEPPPAKKGGKKAVAEDDEDGDDPFAEDDDEEEAPPPPKKKRK